MKLKLVVALALLLLATPAMAQKVYIDFDQDYDFDTIKTFAWKKTPETSLSKSAPLLHSRLVNGIEHYLSMAGIQETDGEPDAYVTYHTSTEQKMSLQTTDFGYGYPGSWYRGGYYGRYGYSYGMGTTSTTVHTYDIGTLVVDVWDAKSQKLVWRGMAANITVVDNPEKMGKKLDKALKKIVSQSKKIGEKNKKKKAKS